MDFQGGDLLQILNLSAQALFTAGGDPAAGLRIKSHSVICAQPGSQRAESAANVVRHALRTRARIVAIQILAHVEDKVRRAAARIRHLEQRRPGPIRHEGLRRGVVVAGQQDDLGHCGHLPDRRHTGLHCRRPGRAGAEAALH